MFEPELLFPFEFEFALPLRFLFRPLFEFMLLALPFDIFPFDILPLDMVLLLVVVVVVVVVPVVLLLEFLFPQFFAKMESASRSRTTIPCLIWFSPVAQD